MFFLAPICACSVLLFPADGYQDRFLHVKELVSEFITDKDLKFIISETSELLRSPLVEGPSGGHLKTYLSLMNKEAKFLESLDQKKKEEFFKNLKELGALQDQVKFGLQFYDNKKTNEIFIKIKNATINESIIFYRIESFIISFDATGNDDEKLKKINDALVKYKTVFGDKNPELYRIYYLYIVYYNSKNLKKELLKYCNEIKNLIPQGYPNGFNLKFYADVYYLKHLTNSESDIAEAYDFYKKIDKSNIFSYDSGSVHSRIEYFQSCIKIFKYLKSDYNLIEMQENLINALKVLNKNKNDDTIQSEAVVLRDMLARKKEFKALRKVEAEFRLDPLPKLPGEE